MSEPLVVVTWNLNGLSDEPELLPTRAALALREIQPHRPHIIMFQELVWPLEEVLFPRLKALGYRPIHTVDQVDLATYYIGMYTRLPGICRKKPFAAGSDMNRYLLNAALEWRGEPLGAMTSHLESTAEGCAPELRCAQAREVLTTLGVCPRGVFGADTNLRVAEWSQLAPMMHAQGIRDAWVERGMPRATQYTWNCQRNDTLRRMRDPKPKMRLDQVWCKGLRCVSFELLGTTRVDDFIRFASDHFGILAKFEPL